MILKISTPKSIVQNAINIFNNVQILPTMMICYPCHSTWVRKVKGKPHMNKDTCDINTIPYPSLHFSFLAIFRLKIYSLT